MNRLSLALGISFICTGCATIVNDANHPIRIETRTQSGQFITGADCTLTNDYGTTSTKSGETTRLRRSSKDLDIRCKHPSHPDATARAISRVNAGMFGNVIIGGAIGAIIDHNKGTAYTYPTWIQMIFGKTLSFDRNVEQQGQPVAAADPTAGT